MTLEDAELLTMFLNEKLTSNSESLDALILNLNNRFLDQRWSERITHKGRELHVEERTQKPPQPKKRQENWIDCPACGVEFCTQCEKEVQSCEC